MKTIGKNSIKVKSRTNVFISLLINFRTSQLVHTIGKTVYYFTTYSIFAMAGMCKFCISLQERLLADGDGSQVLCDHQNVIDSQTETDSVEETSKSQTRTKRKRTNFISLNEFEAAVSKNKQKNIIKWSALPLDIIFKAETIKETFKCREVSL